VTFLLAQVEYTAPIGALSTPTLDRTFFALSDPTRRGILERLGHGPAALGELAGPFGLTINGIKKHVGVLEEVNLVATTKVGRTRQCRLGSADMRGVAHWIDSHRQTMEAQLDSFTSYVETRTRKDR
jgi:DNA-binding transcriptional ArsR family regulator